MIFTALLSINLLPNFSLILFTFLIFINVNLCLISNLYTKLHFMEYLAKFLLTKANVCEALFLGLNKALALMSITVNHDSN